MKPIVLTLLCIFAASAANAYDPGRASGYDRGVDRELFRDDDTARKMQNDFKREGNNNDMQREWQQPANEEQRRLKRDFYQQNEQPRAPREPRGKKVRQI